MANQKTFSQIVQSMLDRLRLTQPNLDTKAGTVSRDLFVDIQADQIDRLYKSVKLVSDKQDPGKATGKDLERWARNYGLVKKNGASANGIIVYTTNELNSDIPIPNGTLNTARNGAQFKSIGNFIMSVSEKNKYAANASRLRSALNLAGITDKFAIEVPAVSTRVGTSGNISPLQIINTDLFDGLKVVNLTSFSGGTNLESDNAFRARIFAIFSGSNTGTEAGYRNAALGTQGVIDSIVIKPGSTLMLRDGTETIKVNDGAFRILNSGTGGKVDLYVLGKNLEEVFESFLYTDLSGVGDPTDERNDLLPGLQGLDQTLTSQERRVKAFSEGKIPLQPVSSVVSLVGSSSGILTEAFIDADGVKSGNYELSKDLNPSTGGSPFGFDKIKFISNVKLVDGESITKSEANSIDPLRFSEINNLYQVHQDVQISSENSGRSLTDKSIIKLNHFPALAVSRVFNVSTGERYVVENQNTDSKTGLNLTGEILISGKTLPSSSDILSVDYTWRHIFDKYIDFNGSNNVGVFEDPAVNDSIDWGVGNGIFREASSVSQTDDGFEFTVSADYDISRVLSVYFAEEVSSATALIKDSDDEDVKGLELLSSSSEISNIISITNQAGVEVYYTEKSDGTFSSRSIFLPTDTSAETGELLTVFYNKVEVFDISGGNGSFSGNQITLPSEDILQGEELLQQVDSGFLSEEPIYISYVASVPNLVPSVSLSSLPINGSGTGNQLLTSSLSSIVGSNQPIFFEFDNLSEVSGISKFGPTRVALEVSDTSTSGRLKVTGTTLTRYNLIVTAGLSVNGLKFDVESELKAALGVSTLPASVSIARVDDVSGLDSDAEYDVAGQTLKDNLYAFRSGNEDSSLKAYEFVLPSTDKNKGISLTGGEEVLISLLLADSSDFETLYFPTNSIVTTEKVFGRIDAISVASGFRSASGNLIGAVTATSSNQPIDGLTYQAKYDFISPKEGERLTLRYNLNKLVTNVTSRVETVRSITADVLVKEAFEIAIDVSGEIVLAKDAESGGATVLENVINAVVNLLNTSSLGSSVDYSDIITVVAGVAGVESVNISKFNESGENGRKTVINALENQSLIAGIVNFVVKSRQDFRIT